MSVNFRTVEILREIKKTILMRGYNNVDWDVFEFWVNDLITEETEAGNEQTASNLQLIKDWCKIAKRKNCSDENRYGATNDFLFIHRAIEERYNSWVDGEEDMITDKYNVIANCSDGDVKIGKDGVYDFTLDEAKEIANTHKNMGVEISVVKL